jgi:hypothetical protein
MIEPGGQKKAVHAWTGAAKATLGRIQLTAAGDRNPGRAEDGYVTTSGSKSCTPLFAVAAHHTGPIGEALRRYKI